MKVNYNKPEPMLFNVTVARKSIARGFIKHRPDSPEEILECLEGVCADIKNFIEENNAKENRPTRESTATKLGIAASKSGKLGSGRSYVRARKR